MRIEKHTILNPHSYLKCLFLTNCEQPVVSREGGNQALEILKSSFTYSKFYLWGLSSICEHLRQLLQSTIVYNQNITIYCIFNTRRRGGHQGRAWRGNKYLYKSVCGNKSTCPSPFETLLHRTLIKKGRARIPKQINQILNNCIIRC